MRMRRRSFPALTAALVAAGVMVMAPAPGAAQPQVVVPSGKCDLPVTAPATTAHRDLGPKDPPIIACLEQWFCYKRSARSYTDQIDMAFKKIRDSETKKLGLREVLELAVLFVELNDTAFGSPSDEVYWDAFLKSENKSGVLDPPKGGKATMVWHVCYTGQELKKMRRDAVRWARYILEVLLPQQLGPDRSQWDELLK